MSHLFQKCTESAKQDGFEKMLSAHVAEIADYITENPESGEFNPKGIAELILSDQALKEELKADELSQLEEAMSAHEPLPAPSVKKVAVEPESAAFIEAAPSALRITPRPKPDPEIQERDGEGVPVVNDYDFENWGRTVKVSAPSKTCFPTTKVGVQNCVNWARTHGKRVRAAGYRHTWSDLYCNKADVLISMLPIRVAEKIPTPDYPYDPDSELGAITEASGSTDPDHQLVRVGAATSNEHLRQWCLENGRWTIPFNVVMVEITFGGSNGPICHGAGLQHATLSDLVAEVEYVNYHGELVVVSDEELLKSAAGCFGLLGIVVSLTLRLDKMSYAHMRPRAKPVVLSIPPPEGYQVPENIAIEASKEELEDAYKEFVHNCETSYYNEYFWFPLQEDCWINCWNNDGNPSNAEDYPNKIESKFQAIGLTLLNALNDSLFRIIPPRGQTIFVGGLSMSQLRQNEDYVVAVSNGLHFARGIQNLRCWDIEWEVPIPGKVDDPSKPDWSIVQKCWWDVINAVYRRYNANDRDIPMRLTFEMRIMGGSKITMAPQYGNDLGTCSIEMLSFDTVGAEEWQEFMQEITDEWSKYTDANGTPLKIRPHWAKQWKGLTVRGKPIMEYLKEVYADNIEKFKADLTEIGQQQNVSLEQMQSLFSNEVLDQVIFGA